MLCLSTNAVIKINIYVLQEAENGMDIRVITNSDVGGQENSPCLFLFI